MNRPTEPFEGLIGGRKSIDYPFGAHPTNDPHERVHDNTLEDVGHSLPFGRGLDDGFDVLLEPDGKEATEMVENSLQLFSRGYGSLRDSVRAFVEAITVDLMFGPSYLEIEFFWREDDMEKKPVAFLLHAPPAETITERRNRYTQRVQGAPGGEIQLVSADIVRIDLPKQLRADADALVALNRAGSRESLVSTDFVTGAFGRRTGFDVKAHRALLDEVVLTGTRASGWTARGFYAEGLLDPARAWRALTLARFQVAVRDIAIAALQRALDRAGEAIGFSVTMTLSRVLTSEDITKMEAALADGSRPISELTHPFLRPATRSQD